MVMLTDNQWDLSKCREVSRDGKERCHGASEEGWDHIAEEELGDRDEHKASDDLVSSALDTEVQNN